MKKILKFGWLLAFSVLLFTGCDSIAGNDIDEKQLLDSGTTGDDSWTIYRYLDEEDGVLTETIAYQVINPVENYLRGFSLTKIYNSEFVFWGGTILATNEDKVFYTNDLGYLIECDNTSIKFITDGMVPPSFERDYEGNDLYSFTFSGQLTNLDVKKLAATSLDFITIALKNKNGGSDEIPVNQEFLYAVNTHLLP